MPRKRTLSYKHGQSRNRIRRKKTEPDNQSLQDSVLQLSSGTSCSSTSESHRSGLASAPLVIRPALEEGKLALCTYCGQILTYLQLNDQNVSRGYTEQPPANYYFNEEHVVEHYCGPLDVICESCQSKNFAKERPQDGKFTVCCQKGKVDLPKLNEPPQLLKHLLTGEHPMSKNFLENIRSFNSAFGFASMGAAIAAPPGNGPYCFRIHGQIYHRTGTLHPDGDEERIYSQIYILDADEALQCRTSHPENTQCDSNLMDLLAKMMEEVSPFARAFKMLYQVEQEAMQASLASGRELPKICMAIVQDRNSDKRRYNAPKVNEVAIVFQNADGEPPLERDLLIHLKSSNSDPCVPKVRRISILDPNLEAMVYPMLIPHGDQGWSITMPLRGATVRSHVTQMQYYGYRFAVRDDFNIFLNSGKLSQQFIVDSYVKTEANRLNYIRTNQSKLRVELYSGLVDHINSEAEREGLIPGKPVVLPSSFQGSPRNMQQNYQDAMAIVRKFGKPDLFVTMTCNPKWREITENLQPWQKVEFRPDLVSRVFQLKLKELLNDICKKHCLGIVIAKIHVIEFQKRGLPHAHILLILRTEDKIRTTEQINDIVRAEIPSQLQNPRLHEIVLKHMIHGPCGSENLFSPCMVNGECSKGFPKEFLQQTEGNVNGFPKYQRRRNSSTLKVRGKAVDNRWVVPYNPFLSCKYNCHINVEVCASVKSVKYLFKYVYKGHDCASIQIQETDTHEHNEINMYMDSRYNYF
jgi:hypothetical protein